MSKSCERGEKLPQIYQRVEGRNLQHAKPRVWVILHNAVLSKKAAGLTRGSAPKILSYHQFLVKALGACECYCISPFPLLSQGKHL